MFSLPGWLETPFGTRKVRANISLGVEFLISTRKWAPL